MKQEEYFCVIDPQGVLVHTTISLSESEAVNQWIETEQSMNFIGNMVALANGHAQRCARSWEQYEAEGYKVVSVRLEKINANTI